MPEEIEFLIKISFLVIGIGGILHAFYSLLMTRAAESWIPVSGRITSHGIEEKRDSDGDYMYKAKVEYLYEYRGRKYKGKRIAFGFGSWNIKWLVQKSYREAISRAPAITVYIDPKNPKISSALSGVRNFHLANITFFTVWNIFIYKIFTSGSI